MKSFSTGIGCGMGFTVGLFGGAVLTGAALYGYLAVRKFLRKHKKKNNNKEVVYS